MSNKISSVEKDEVKKSILQMDVKDIFKFDFLKKDISTKTVLIFITMFIIVGIYGYFIIYPKYTEYKLKVTNLSNVEGELTEYTQRMNEIPLLEEKLDDLKNEAKTKSKKLSHDMEDGLFIIGLDKKINNLGLMLKNYKIDEVVDYNQFYAIPMSIDIDGDYRKVRELIYFLEEQKNVTQVMDYSMNTKLSEIKKETIKRVYWTRGEEYYHLDRECPDMVEGEVLYGTPSQSGGRKPAAECVGDISNTVEVEVNTVANGEVSANIKFIIYSSDKDIIKLETDNPATWKPGKFNPFKDTLS